MFLHQRKLQACQASIYDLNLTIAQEEKEISVARDQMTKLRYWNPAVGSFSDVPPELLILVIKQLGYAHQQRLVRVCKSWMAFMTEDLEHIYLDAESLYLSHRTKSGLLKLFPVGRGSRRSYRSEIHFLGGHLRRSTADEYATSSTLLALAPWQHHRQTVRQLTVDGQYTANFTWISVDVLRMVALHFPNVVQVNLVQVIMNMWEWYEGLKFNDAARLRPFAPLFARLRVSLQACVAPAFPNGSDRYVPEIGLEGLAAQRMLGRRRDAFVPVVDVTWSSWEEFKGYGGTVSDMAWLYPEEQLEWLAPWAPCLNEHPQMMTLLTSEWWHYTGSFVCDSHQKFCDHLDKTFYEEEMAGQSRIFLTVFLLQLNPPGMPPPLMPLRLMKFHLRPGKAVHFDLIT